eukprot:m51a1_g14247 putative arp2 3 complex 34 kda (298) ;mRNA; f:256711-257817
MAPPLTLEFQNRIVHDTVLEKLMAAAAGEKPEVEVTVADFNQVLWHMSCDGTAMKVSVSTKCWPQLQKYSEPHLKATYGAMLTAPETGFDVTIKFNVAPSGKGNAEAAEGLANKVASLARNVMAGPYLYMFDRATKREGAGEMIQIDYRPAESLWLKNEGDRVIAIFSIYFDDPDDVVIGRVFLQEIGKLVQGAPAVDTHLKDPPRELANMRNLRAHGYCSFLLEGRHFAPKQRDMTINLMTQFRNYLHYHLKCSKAYLHIRMRNRVTLLEQVLNRAKMEKPASEKGKGALMFGFRK